MIVKKNNDIWVFYTMWWLKKTITRDLGTSSGLYYYTKIYGLKLSSKLKTSKV